MDIEEFRRRGHALIDWIADYRARVARGELPVMSRAVPGEVRAALPASPPAEAQSLDDLLDELARVIVPG